MISQTKSCIFACNYFSDMEISTLHRRGIMSILALICFTNILSADSYYFYVQLTDKNNTPYSLSNPGEYLSDKAIQRRTEQSILCDSTDLPVNPAYISQISNLNMFVHSASKWMNGVTVLVEDSSLMSQVRTLPFVKWVQYTGKKLASAPIPAAKSKFHTDVLDYGSATDQINQLNGAILHEHNCTGNGIIIGVLDAGFNNVDTNPAFDSLRIQNRLLGVKNIIDPTVNVYNEDSHGANVLSIMAGNLPGQYLGVAPHASYWLIQTEYVPTEYMVEVDFWVRGLEFADSVGVDVVNSSLGYTEFDDPSMNFTYSDMNGTVSRASRAATLASLKGIIVCTSAGNEGSKPWKFISSPADASGILTVGAVNASGSIASFSSYGPTSDNRVKPEVCATGLGTALVNPSGSTVFGNGTSFSSPIIAGLTACYVQFYKSQAPMFYNVNIIRNSIITGSSMYHTPHEQYGYGIANFQAALYNTPTNNNSEYNRDELIKLFYNSRYRQLKILKSPHAGNENYYLDVFSLTGQLTHREAIKDLHTIVNLDYLTTGIYITRISSETKSHVLKIIIP